MTTFPGSPRLLKGGIVLIDPVSGTVKRTISLQYNPDTLTRTLQPQTVGGEGSNQAEALRLKGPPVETWRIEAEVDATDQLEGNNDTVRQVGIQAQLAALETIIYPTSDQLQARSAQVQAGTLEIIPMETDLTLFVWSKHRVVPVRITEFSIIEEAFDPNLNPLRAKITLGLRVLSVDDLGFDHKGGSLFMNYLQQKEQLAQCSTTGTLGILGIGGIP